MLTLLPLMLNLKRYVFTIIIFSSIFPKQKDGVAPKEMNVDSADVTNRWSRYIGAMGIESVRK